MNIEETYLTKEIAQKIKIIELLSSYTDTAPSQIADSVDKAFKEADEVWRNEIMAKILPERELKKLFETSLKANYKPG